MTTDIEDPSGPAAPTAQRCGLVAIVGRPNVGKSTLLNALVGQKVSITSAKAQTTRHRITGIRTVDDTQFVFVDTPGFQTRHSAPLNRTLNRTVQGVLGDVDVVLFVVEAGRFGLDDAKVLTLMHPGKPVFLIANKLDTVVRRADLAPWLKGMEERHAFAEFVPLSAKKAADAQRLLGIVKPYLPEQPWFYEADALTDRSDRFLASEIIREKLFRLTGDELPYTSTVVIDKFEEVDDPEDAASQRPRPEGAASASGGRARPRGNLRRISASIVVERDSHKGIVIGSGGERLKRIGSEARQELETLMDAKASWRHPVSPAIVSALGVVSRGKPTVGGPRQHERSMHRAFCRRHHQLRHRFRAHRLRYRPAHRARRGRQHHRLGDLHHQCSRYRRQLVDPQVSPRPPGDSDQRFEKDIRRLWPHRRRDGLGRRRQLQHGWFQP